MKITTGLLAIGLSGLCFVSAPQAADLIVDTAPMMPGVVDSSTSWDGPFVGVFGGYGWGSIDFEGAPPNAVVPEPEGWLLGVNAGVNFTLTHGIVAGVVGDLAWADITDTIVTAAPSSLTSTIDWQGSVRGRVGFDGGAFLPYLTAGLAFAHNTIEGTAPGPVARSDDQVHVGWTAGAGVAFAATENLSIDLLYRYSDYGTATYNFDGNPANDADVGLTSHTLTVGLNFAF